MNLTCRLSFTTIGFILYLEAQGLRLSVLGYTLNPKLHDNWYLEPIRTILGDLGLVIDLYARGFRTLG